MIDVLRQLWSRLSSAFVDVLPALSVILFFQFLVIGKPLPHMADYTIGFVLVIAGMFLFIEGLETALFPAGEGMAVQFAAKGNIWWLIVFGFALGFAATIAEPTLTIIARKAGQVAADAGAISSAAGSIRRYVFGLRLTVAVAVGLSTAVGVVRIIKGWPLAWFILSGYLMVITVTAFAPAAIIGIAYDAGGITTSAITVPLVTALGLGLASSIRGRHPLIDGFGLIALASLTPILFVLLFGIAIHGGR